MSRFKNDWGPLLDLLAAAIIVAALFFALTRCKTIVVINIGFKEPQDSIKAPGSSHQAVKRH